MAENGWAYQKVGFFDWLIKEINSGNYEGLSWTDESRTAFCIPWKHNSRKDLVDTDYKIFKAWAMFSNKYNEDLQNPAKWKLNFRCAMMSTKRFEEVKLNNPNYHVYRIISPKSSTAAPANYPANTSNLSDPEDDLHISPNSEAAPALSQPTPSGQQEIHTAFKALSLENQVQGSDGSSAGDLNQHSEDILQWVLQQANLTETFSWANAPVAHPPGAVAYEQGSVYAIPHVNQNGCLSLGNGVVNEPGASNGYEKTTGWLAASIPTSQPTVTLPLQPAQQISPVTNQINHVEALYKDHCFTENLIMNEEPLGNGMMNHATVNDFQPASQQIMMEPNLFGSPVEQPPVNTAPAQNGAGTNPLNLDVFIYYRGKLLYETVVDTSSCLLTYNNHYNYSAFDNLRIIQFPSLEVLPDQKQVQHTLTILQVAGLLLYQKNEKLCAKRLGKCKVFWAFSKQLDNIAEPPPTRMLPREEDVEIFNYGKFCQELKEFHDSLRHSSPDYTIYLCFGQCFSAAKPKESRLILVKLVPKLCKHWHECVQREGVSSLDSENMSLEISNSLYDMMDYLNNILMQMEEAA
ncbi:interferon regulatory factor 7 isoform X2 [Varanus komodoensis]|uniref:Interferon regulatory factor 7 n=1 Tax=Varanus komodoensis TaxID=61221 RepID=A0A8D2IW57_VARKO|nr:interferon regulatory factor 7 isoform X2 [Varanus komodoensis]